MQSGVSTHPKGITKCSWHMKFCSVMSTRWPAVPTSRTSSAVEKDVFCWCWAFGMPRAATVPSLPQTCNQNHPLATLKEELSLFRGGLSVCPRAVSNPALQIIHFWKVISPEARTHTFFSTNPGRIVELFRATVPVNCHASITVSTLIQPYIILAHICNHHSLVTALAVTACMVACNVDTGELLLLSL